MTWQVLSLTSATATEKLTTVDGCLKTESIHERRPFLVSGFWSPAPGLSQIRVPRRFRAQKETRLWEYPQKNILDLVPVKIRR